MSKIKNGGLDQYGAGPFEKQQFGTAGDEGLTEVYLMSALISTLTYELTTVQQHQDSEMYTYRRLQESH